MPRGIRPLPVATLLCAVGRAGEEQQAKSALLMASSREARVRVRATRFRRCGPTTGSLSRLRSVCRRLRLVRLREDDEVAIRVAQPQLAVTGIRVDVHVGNYIGASVAAPPDDGVEVVGLKPHRDAVAERGVGVGERAVVVRSFQAWSWRTPSSRRRALARIRRRRGGSQPPRPADTSGSHAARRRRRGEAAVASALVERKRPAGVTRSPIGCRAVLSATSGAAPQSHHPGCRRSARARTFYERLG